MYCAYGVSMGVCVPVCIFMCCSVVCSGCVLPSVCECDCGSISCSVLHIISIYLVLYVHSVRILHPSAYILKMV